MIDGLDLLKLLCSLEKNDDTIKIKKKDLLEKLGIGKTWFQRRVVQLYRTGFIDWKSCGKNGIEIKILKIPDDKLVHELLTIEWAREIERRIDKLEDEF
jgi:hypothetical protein